MIEFQKRWNGSKNDLRPRSGEQLELVHAARQPSRVTPTAEYEEARADDRAAVAIPRRRACVQAKRMRRGRG